MVNPSFMACFFCCSFLVWDFFFHDRKISHSYPDPILKKDCISTIMCAISISIFNLEQLPAAQIYLAGLQENWDFAAGDLFENQHLKASRHCCPACESMGKNWTTSVSPIPRTTADPCIPVWWELLPAGGFCDQPPHLGAAATTSGGCLSASECPPGTRGSSGSAPSPSSSRLHIWPCGSCTPLREPSRRTGDMSAQLTPHQLRARGCPVLCYCKAYVSKSPVSYQCLWLPWALRWFPLGSPHTSFCPTYCLWCEACYAVFSEVGTCLSPTNSAVLCLPEATNMQTDAHKCILKLQKRLLFQFRHASLKSTGLFICSQRFFAVRRQ